MPFKSSKQRRYLWANEPEVAEKWAREEKKKKKSFKRKEKQDARNSAKAER